jgi:formate dehydrogenase maturation protein FdhE
MRRLIAVNGQVIDCLKWSIHNKELECEKKLQPVVEGIASILVDMIEREEENFTRRGRIRLVKKHSA